MAGNIKSFKEGCLKRAPFYFYPISFSPPLAGEMFSYLFPRGVTRKAGAGKGV